MLVVCPASLTLKWKAEMGNRFGLEFRVVDTAMLRELRRTRGLSVNPFKSFPRLIVSIDWLKRPGAMRLPATSSRPTPAPTPPVRPADRRRGPHLRARGPGSLRPRLPAHRRHPHDRPSLRAPPLPLGKPYNRVHNPDDRSPGIGELRDLHVALDLAVRDAYGWSDLDLDHGFWDTPQGRRFTLGPGARTEVLDRLLELNHERYAEEVAAGLHDKKKATSRRKTPAGYAPTLV